MRSWPTRGHDARRRAQMRDPAAVVPTARALLGLTVAISVASTLIDLAQGVTRPHLIVVIMFKVVLPGCCLFVLAPRATLGAVPHYVWTTVLPLVSIWGAAAAAVSAGNTMPTAQYYLGVPVLYGAYLLRARAATVISANAVLANAISLLAVTTRQEAAHGVLYGTVSIVMITVLLQRLRDEQERFLARLQWQARRDQLTGLANRRSLQAAIEDAVRLGTPSEDAPAGWALLLIDVDRFKEINDEHGHLIGDRVLVEIGRRISAVMPSRATVARWGGDELAVLLPAGPDGAREIADQVLAHVAGAPHDDPAGARIALSVTVGVAHLPTQASDAESLYRCADDGLYLAKQRGRAQVGVVARDACGLSESVA